MIVTFNKNIIQDIISKADINLNIEKVVYARFDNHKHKTVIAYKANTASGLAFKGVKSFPVEGIITYNKGNNSIILFDTCYLVWDIRLNVHKFEV